MADANGRIDIEWTTVGVGRQLNKVLPRLVATTEVPELTDGEIRDAMDTARGEVRGLLTGPSADAAANG